jgi:AcrR family transcriptional regulator
MRRTKEDAEKTKQLIIETAVDLFAAKGVEAITLQNIAEKAKCTRGAIYWHFKNKRDLINQIISDYKKSETEGFHELSEKATSYSNLLKEYALWSLKKASTNTFSAKVEKILYNNIEPLRKSGVDYNIDHDIEFFADTFRKAKKEGEIESDLSPKDMTFMYLSFLYGIGTMVYSKDKLEYEKKYGKFIDKFLASL